MDTGCLGKIKACRWWTSKTPSTDNVAGTEHAITWPQFRNQPWMWNIKASNILVKIFIDSYYVVRVLAVRMISSCVDSGILCVATLCNID